MEVEQCKASCMKIRSLIMLPDNAHMALYKVYTHMHIHISLITYFSHPTPNNYKALSYHCVDNGNQLYYHHQPPTSITSQINCGRRHATQTNPNFTTQRMVRFIHLLIYQCALLYSAIIRDTPGGWPSLWQSITYPITASFLL